MVDIRPIKKELRKKHKDIRKNMIPSHKERCDLLIFDKVANHEIYKNADLLLCFVSTQIEVDTIRLIKYALRQGKTVAVPRCHDNEIAMTFYTIDSIDDLETGAFSVLEPNVSICKQLDVSKFKTPLCIVPGLSFDNFGFRLGYGKGYYDRFLSGFNGVTAGVCYSECIEPELVHGRYDRAVDYLFTDKEVVKITE